MKTYGANIVCCVCGAQPYPDGPTIEERFDLMRLDDAGRPSESPNAGQWFCGLHYLARTPRKAYPKAEAVGEKGGMTFDPRLAYGIEVFALDDDEGDDGPMREAVAGMVAGAKTCAFCGDKFAAADEDEVEDDDSPWGLDDLLEPGPVAAFIARPMPRSPRKRLVRVGVICQRCFETMSERAIDEALTERAPAWAADDEKDARK